MPDTLEYFAESDDGRILQTQSQYLVVVKCRISCVPMGYTKATCTYDVIWDDFSPAYDNIIQYSMIGSLNAVDKPGSNNINGDIIYYTMDSTNISALKSFSKTVDVEPGDSIYTQLYFYTSSSGIYARAKITLSK